MLVHHAAWPSSRRTGALRAGLDLDAPTVCVADHECGPPRALGDGPRREAGALEACGRRIEILDDKPQPGGVRRAVLGGVELEDDVIALGGVVLRTGAVGVA